MEIPLANDSDIQEGETKVEIISFVLDIIDHKTYDKIFGYRKV